MFFYFKDEEKINSKTGSFKQIMKSIDSKFQKVIEK
jgi:hypothetical protein